MEELRKYFCDDQIADYLKELGKLPRKLEPEKRTRDRRAVFERVFGVSQSDFEWKLEDGIIAWKKPSVGILGMLGW